jgi:hypothetical protein
MTLKSSREHIIPALWTSRVNLQHLAKQASVQQRMSTRKYTGWALGSTRHAASCGFGVYFV